MLPYRDHNKSASFPLLTYLLIAINIAVFIYTYRLNSQDPILYNEFISRFAFYPSIFTENIFSYRIISSIFMHGDLMHLAGNMLYLFILGDNIEDKFGKIKFLLFYFLSGIAASVGHYYFDTASIIPTIGASGAIAGIMGGYILLFPKAKVDALLIVGFFVQRVTVSAFYLLGIWFIIQAIQAANIFFSPTSLGGGIAFGAHFVGFVAGLLLAYPMKIYLSRNRKTL